jgi:hypothetical protein
MQAPMLLPTVAPGTYGAATATIQRVLAEAATITWFPVLSAGHPPAVEANVLQHLTRLNELFQDHSALTDKSIRWVEGDLRTFDPLCSTQVGTESEDWGWGDPFVLTSWGRRLAKLSRDVQEQILDTPQLLELVGPPLWPLSKRFNVVGSAIFEPPPPRDLQPDPRWAMLTHVQFNFQNLLVWALAMPTTLESSPFYSLFQLHISGYYPVGTVSGAFTIFGRTS